MIPKNRSKPSSELTGDSNVAESDAHDIPTKAEILEDISEGYRFVMSGGRGQPIDDIHREIEQELAREELAQNADLRSIAFSDTKDN